VVGTTGGSHFGEYGRTRPGTGELVGNTHFARLQHRSRAWIAGATASALVAVGLVAAAPASAAVLPTPAPVEQRNAATVTADTLPTVQIDSGVVWTQLIVGNTVYAGGSFSNARPANAAPGQNLMPRSNILAYDIDTGVATSFAPVINGQVKSLAVSPDGKTLYVGGAFTQVDGQSRYNVAAFDVATGALLTKFKPAIGGSYVSSIVATSSTVYFGGLLGAAGGIVRKNFAAVSATNGAVLNWAPTSDLQVDSMILNPTSDKVIAAGRFTLINGVSQRGLVALDPATGAILPYDVTNTVKNGLSVVGADGKPSSNAGIWSLASDNTGAVYGTAWNYSGGVAGNLEGVFSVDGQSGAIRWIADCHGDHYGVYSDGKNVYSTSHAHDCSTIGAFPQNDVAPGNLRHATAVTVEAKGTVGKAGGPTWAYTNWQGQPAPAAVNWYPEWTTGTATGQGQAGWTVTGNGKYLLVGGEFPFVNSKRNQGIARFAVVPAGGAKQAPRLADTTWVPTATSPSPGAVQVQIPGNWDRDDLNLTYELWQPGATAPVESRSAASPFWAPPAQTFSKNGFADGSTQTFYVVAKDADGNIARSADVSVIVATTPPPTPPSTAAYPDQVTTDGASLYWRFGATAGASTIGANSILLPRGAVSSTTGGIAGADNGSVSFPGNANGSSAATSVGTTFAVELWFKTSTAAGGKLVGFGNAAQGNSSVYADHLYLTDGGNLVFGAYPNRVATVQSAATYRDNAWHHAVGQISPTSGMELYVDGKLVASDPTVTAGKAESGFWRIAGDNLAGWPGAVTSSNYAGAIDEFAVYPKALTAQQIASHFAKGSTAGAPTATPIPGSFTVTGAKLDWSFVNRTRAPLGRTITAQVLDFGDGTSVPFASGATVAHTYAAAGTYTVRLTITENTGATWTNTQTVTATAP
jgi:hypothetical protein